MPATPETIRKTVVSIDSIAIHMPRWACRLRLPLVKVRIERVQSISEADAWAEGYGEHRQSGSRNDGADGPLGRPDPRGWFAMHLGISCMGGVETELGSRFTSGDRLRGEPMRTIRLQIAATVSHCGSRDNDCRYSTEVGSNCHLFGKARQRRNPGCGFTLTAARVHRGREGSPRIRSAQTCAVWVDGKTYLIGEELLTLTSRKTVPAKNGSDRQWEEC